MSSVVPHPEPDRVAPEVMEAYRNAPPHLVAEVLDGELVLMPRPSRRHAHAASRLLGRLTPYSDPEGEEPGGWLILVEPELHLGSRPDIVVPDLAGWRLPRLPPDFLADDAPPHITLAPDWACEALSPSTERYDRGKKMRIYRREGVGHVWLVSPIARIVEVYRLEQRRWVLTETYEGDGALRAEPFERVELPLRALWSLRATEAPPP
ncbi:MAG: Uma2 family endonuclease [Terriglobales bacterium]